MMDTRIFPHADMPDTFTTTMETSFMDSHGLRYTTPKGYYLTMGLEMHVAFPDQKLVSHTQDVSLMDAGLPGVLPMVDVQALQRGMAFTAMVGGKLSAQMAFERKHYWYADLPLGYQITQERDPVCVGGAIPVWSEELDDWMYVELDHAHLEVDAAKSEHGTRDTWIDLSRCGVALLEIVTKPVLYHPDLARATVDHTLQMVRYSGISDAELESGSFRVDVSLSLSTDPDRLGHRVEIKGMSSLSAIDDAIAHEIARQELLLQGGQEVVQETRQWDMAARETVRMRDKESAAEYRFMPEPDIPVLDTASSWSLNMMAQAQCTYRVDYSCKIRHIRRLARASGVTVSMSQLSKMAAPMWDPVWTSLETLSDAPLRDRLLRAVGIWWWEVVARVFPDGHDVDTSRLDVGAWMRLVCSELDAGAIKDIMGAWMRHGCDASWDWDGACAPYRETKIARDEMGAWLDEMLCSSELQAEVLRAPLKVKGYLTGLAKKKWGTKVDVAGLHEEYAARVQRGL